MQEAYLEFLRAKMAVAKMSGLDVSPKEAHRILKPHQRDIVTWAVRGGQRAIFAAFGLGKSLMQLEICRLILAKKGGCGLIVCPLGVRQEFIRDAKLIKTPIKFVRTDEEITHDGLYLTNYESVREGKLNPKGMTVVSLDEAAILRGFGGTKTFREFMGMFEGTSTYRFVATATPDPNEYIELLAYAAFLGIMDVGESKTRFFKRDSTKADKLTLYPHKAEEFWLWVSSWSIFAQRPSDLGHSDEGYALPPMVVRWHEVETDHAAASPDSNGQGRMFKEQVFGLSAAAREKRQSLPVRLAKAQEILAEDPGAHFLIWHDLESERKAIEETLPEVTTVWGTQDLDEREQSIMDFSDGKIKYLATKPVIAGSGCNFQRHCHRAIFLGIGFKFNDFIQAIHRIHRFLQDEPVQIDLIYTEAEASVRKTLQAKWDAYTKQAATMSAIIREHGLACVSMEQTLKRTIGVKRQEESGETFRAVNNDCVIETADMEADSVGLIVTSIPFAFQYEYTPSYNDFGHTENNDHFWQQMDFLSPHLFRVLKPGRVMAIHVKDRIVPGGLTGFGFQTLHPFHSEAIAHYKKHGFAFLGMKTVVTDVVRENNQTYRLGWTEQCKDGSRMGCGVPEYVLLFRKPPTDRSNGYADEPVVKDKPLCDDNGEPAPFDSTSNWQQPIPGTGYSRSRWQLDAHGFARSSGNRLLTAEELATAPHEAVFKRWREESTTTVYDFDRHVGLCEAMDRERRLPATFMVMPPHSWHPDVWTDVARMRTLNMEQERRGQEQHLCLALGTLILTSNGYKPIQDVTVGDEVLTHMGRWRRVLAVQNTGVRPVVTVMAQGVPGLTLTPDHKLWTRKVRDAALAQSHSRKEAAKTDPTWVPASDTVGSYVNLKLPPAEPASNESERYWWLVGRWLADGHFDSGGGAIISVGAKKLDAFMNRLGDFGGNPAHGTGTCFQVLLRDPGKSLRRTLAMCGKYADGKHLPPEAFTLPQKQAEALLSGYLSGDGHYLESRNRWMASSASKPLLLGLAMLAQRAYGAIASVYAGRPPGETTIEGRVVPTKQDWIFCFDIPDGKRKNGLPFILDDGAWLKVRSVEPAGEVETWNLRVEEDESFTAEGCIVKNCPLQFDIVNRLINQLSNPGDVVFDPFGGLMTVPYCAIKLKRFGMGVELNTGYWRDGARYCRAAEGNRTVPTLFDALEAEEVPA